MTRPEHPLQQLTFDADLRVELDGRRAVVSARGSDVSVEVPDVVTGLALCRSALPRGLRRRLLDAVAHSGLTVNLTVRGRSVLTAAGGKSGLLSLVGLPHLKLKPLALALAGIGR